MDTVNGELSTEESLHDIDIAQADFSYSSNQVDVNRNFNQVDEITDADGTGANTDSPAVGSGVNNDILTDGTGANTDSEASSSVASSRSKTKVLDVPTQIQPRETLKPRRRRIEPSAPGANSRTKSP